MDPWDLSSEPNSPHPKEKGSVLREARGVCLASSGGQGGQSLGKLLSRATSHPKRLGTHSGQVHCLLAYR